MVRVSHSVSISPLVVWVGTTSVERFICNCAVAPASTAGSVGMVAPSHLISIFSRLFAAYCGGVIESLAPRISGGSTTCITFEFVLNSSMTKETFSVSPSATNVFSHDPSLCSAISSL